MYELTFWGGVDVPHIREHQTAEAAEAEALRVLALLQNRGASPAIIYGPGLGANGRTIR